MSDDDDDPRIKIGPLRIGSDPGGLDQERLSATERRQRDSWFGSLFGGLALAGGVLFVVVKYRDMALPAFLGAVIVIALVKMYRSGWAQKK